MGQQDADDPLILQFTTLIHERRRAVPEDRAKCNEQIEQFVDKHKDDVTYVRRAKMLLDIEEAREHKGGDHGIS